MKFVLFETMDRKTRVVSFYEAAQHGEKIVQKLSGGKWYDSYVSFKNMNDLCSGL